MLGWIWLAAWKLGTSHLSSHRLDRSSKAHFHGSDLIGNKHLVNWKKVLINDVIGILKRTFFLKWWLSKRPGFLITCLSYLFFLHLLRLTWMQNIQTMAAWLICRVPHPSSQQWQPNTFIAELQSLLSSVVSNSASAALGTVFRGINKLNHATPIFPWWAMLSSLSLKKRKVTSVTLTKSLPFLYTFVVHFNSKSIL